MNILKRVCRKLGFDIVRYANHSVNQQKQSIDVQKRGKVVISPELAKQALESVGRKSKVAPFTYFERPQSSSSQMEEAENKWWNEHGNLVEELWVLSDEINHVYRSAYVDKAATFFAAHEKKARILDLGCGSGWFGRMIASDKLDYVGMDFSSTQISIANKKAANSPNKEHLKFYCTTDIESIPDLDKTTGVIINAFLHHLYWDDLKKLFDKLHAVLPDGCKFYITEPIYPDPIELSPEQKEKVKDLSNLVDAFRKHIGVHKNALIEKKQYNLKPEIELKEIITESSENGFFFSPKEVPFRMGEFKEFLEKYMKIENHYFCGITNIEAVQFLDFVTEPKARKELIKNLMSFSESLDKVLNSEGYFELKQGSYLFTCFECILKK